MATIGTLVAGIAHEINNPLTSVLANLQFIAQRIRDPELLLPLDEARTAAERVRGIISDLKSFSRADDASRVPLDPRKVLDASLQMARTAIRDRAKLVRSASGSSLVLASEARLGPSWTSSLPAAAIRAANGFWRIW